MHKEYVHSIHENVVLRGSQELPSGSVVLSMQAEWPVQSQKVPGRLCSSQGLWCVKVLLCGPRQVVWEVTLWGGNGGKEDYGIFLVSAPMRMIQA